MDPKDFARVARSLAKGDIAAKRTAVSRLYYAMHHIAWGVIGGKPPESGARHGIAIEKLDGLNAAAAARLRDMHARRKVADYELNTDEKFVDISADFARYESFLKDIGYQ